MRVGVLIDSASLPRWAHVVVADLTTSEQARLVLVVRNGGGASVRVRRSLFAAYEALDRRFSRAPDDYAEPVDSAALLEGCENLTVVPQRRGEVEELSATDIEAIRAHDLDVLLQLGFGRLEGRVLGAARYGVWLLWHDELERRGVPPLFWEMLRGDPAVETRLEAHTPDGPRLLYRSAASMERSSLYLNRNAAYWKSSAFVTRALRSLETGRPALLPTVGATERLPARTPNAFETLRFAATTAARILRNRMQMRGARCEWFLALRTKGGPPWRTPPPWGFEELVNPRGRFRADPFLFLSDGGTWLFFEEAEFATEKGVIGCMEIGPDGTCSEVGVVLERDYHLSYPFVFEWEGAHYMIPETSENRTIELYRATDFPRRWELEKVLFHDVFAVDTTLLEADGRFWLFSAMSEAGGSGNDELFLFHADSPLGAWTPHPSNPIVSDVRCARPAGRVFRQDGAWIRPGQDCSSSYGAAIQLQRIEVLNEREYREVPIGRIDPNWAPSLVATHTIDEDGGLAVIDGRRWMPRNS